MATIVMSAELRVSYTVVITKSDDMQNKKGTIADIMGFIEDKITALSSIWEGSAFEVFKNKFNNLKADINKMLRVAQEYSDDLKEIAESYRSAEDRARVEAEGLKSEGIFNI